MSGMRQFLVDIPGIESPETVFADGEDAAITEALWNRGMHFAPPGITVTHIDAPGEAAGAEA